MKFKELKEQGEAALNELLKNKHQEVRSLRFKIANDALKDVRLLRKTKKVIAQILTLLHKPKV